MLYFVATPIGNLKDVSYRAIETLNMVDEIACEDTRHSATFLNYYGIKKPLFSYHKFNEKESGEKIVEKLKSGLNIAVISDAGMPIISDPGNVLVKMLIENNLDYTIIPGASAVVCAFALSGIEGEFCFIGFLPQKNSQRVELLNKYKNLNIPLIFYSAPHDIKKDIESIYQVLGDRPAVAVKEITKLHEKVIRFNLKNGLGVEPKGEFVLIVDKSDTEQNIANTLSEEEHIALYINQGIDKKEAIKKVAKERGVSKSSLYKWTIEKD